MRSLVYLHVKAMFVYRGRVFRALLVVMGGIGMAKVGQGVGAARFGIWERMGTGHLSTAPRQQACPSLCPHPCYAGPGFFFMSFPPPHFFFAVFIVHDSSLGRDNEKDVGARGLLPACGALKRKETSRCLSCGVTAILQRESNAVQNPLSKNPCRCCSLVTHVKAFCFCICPSQKSVSQTR